MNTRAMLMLGLSALVFGGTTVGCTATHSMLTAASTQAVGGNAAAARQADKARKALAHDNADQAVRFAEAAVGMAPDDAGHRALLGEAYLRAGRFASARDAFNDALTLDPGNGGVALNLALAQIALGDSAEARATLAAHSDAITPSDRGLALALAGDPAGGVQILGNAVRDPNTDAKTRQNLALALALAGRWPEAKSIAAIDISPADVDARIMQWSQFARPAHAYDQVAALLGVTPVEDAGQPVQLALANTSATRLAAADAIDPAQAAPVRAEAEPALQALAAAEPVSEDVAAERAAPVALAQVDDAATESTPGPAISFAKAHEIVQQIPVRAERQAPVRAAAAAAAAGPRTVRASYRPTGGKFVVQLGAYDSAGVARDAWGRLSRRVAALGSMTPSGMSIRTAKGEFYRLSVGGFARPEAAGLCRQVKASGGRCFVREQAGDQVASWVKGPQLASR